MPDDLKTFKNDRDDYLVILNGQMVGGIHKVYRAIDKPWRWSVGSGYKIDGERDGWAVDLPSAKVAFRKAWNRKV